LERAAGFKNYREEAKKASRGNLGLARRASQGNLGSASPLK
jgi:hypothetical protein